MNAKVTDFRALLKVVAEPVLVKYKVDSAIVRMVKVIWESPFCQGNWQNWVNQVWTQ